MPAPVSRRRSALAGMSVSPGLSRSLGTPLPSRNEEWGCYGTARSAGLDPDAVWVWASCAFAGQFGFDPVVVRDLLDSRFGRHWVDDLSFMPGYPAVSAESVANWVRHRFGSRGWLSWLNSALAEAGHPGIRVSLAPAAPAAPARAPARRRLAG